MKSEKVWTSFLVAFSLFAFAANAEEQRSVVTVTVEATVANEIVPTGSFELYEGESVNLRAMGDEKRKFLGFSVNGEFIPQRERAFTYTVPSGLHDATIVLKAVYNTHWYVNPDPVVGKDTNDGWTPETAKRTLVAVMEGPVSGDTVHAAIGVYNDGTVADGSGSTTKCRVNVPAGVTLRGDDRDGTIIEGEAPSSPDQHGLGADAVRGVYLGANAKLCNLTVRTGYTNHRGNTAESQGAGVLGADRTTCFVEDCTIRDCRGSRSGGGHSVTFNRCRLLDNFGAATGAAGRNCSYYNTYIVRCSGNPRSMQETAWFVNSTYDVDENDAATKRNLFEGAKARIENSVFLQPNSILSDGVAFASNCVFVTGSGISAVSAVCGNVVTNTLEEIALDAETRMPTMSSCLVDAGLTAMVERIGDLDCDCGQRVYNGAIDIGAFEYDWRGRYGADIGATVTAAAPEVAERNGAVYLPSGEIALTWDNGAGLVGITAEVTGTGVLEMYVGDGDEPIHCWTAADESLFLWSCQTASANLRFRYVPGENDTDGACLKSLAKFVNYMKPETNEVGDVVFVECVTNAIPVTAGTAAFGDGWYVVTGEVSRTEIDVLTGCTANLILADGASLTVTGDTSCAGIDVRPGETLNVYGQQDGTGRLVATGGSGNGYAGGAGIGGGYRQDGGTVTIYGGTVTAEGGLYAAGIGGGDGGAGGTVTIYGGTVNVVGKLGAQGLGGGSGRGGGANRICGGAVKAEGGEGAYGIGGNTIELGDNMVMFNITDGEPGVEVTSGNYFNIRKSLTTVRQEPVVETFGRGWYVTAERGVYIGTRFKPDSNTRVEMDVDVGDAQEYWFGCWDGNWNDRAFALGNDANPEVYCGYGSDSTCGGINGLIPPGRVTVALEKGVVYTNGVIWSAAHADSNTVFSLNHNLYLFAQNRKGTAYPGWEQKRIVCYGCRIWTNDVNGAKIPVRNFVPARTKDESQTVGLYDTVSGKFYAPCGGALTLGQDEVVVEYAMVTVGDLPPHVTAAWTSGDGSETNVIAGGFFEVPKGTENVKVIFTADPAYELVGGSLVHDRGTVNEDCALEPGNLPQLVHRKVEYVDADGRLRTNDTFAVVTAQTATLSDGCWYVAENTMTCGIIETSGEAKLILADGCELTVDGGIRVEGESSLAIYGQVKGTGLLTAQGAYHCAGIGGGDWSSGGVLMIYGGTVKAEGGEDAYGIGGNTIELGDNMVMFDITDGEPGVEVTSGNYFNIKKSFTTERPKEFMSCNPLEVTTSEDVVDPTDGKISFREACIYLEGHVTAPKDVSADQWPRITFSLPSGSRTVNLLSVVGLSDERRVDGFKPVVIDGGEKGLTIRNNGAGSQLLDLNVAGVVSNVLFSAGTVSVGANKATSADRNMNFENCAFEGGVNSACLVNSSVGNVNFTGCSFTVPSDGKSTGAASLTMASGWASRFDCCTFTGFLGINGAASVISVMDDCGELRLANCTFARNDGVEADVIIKSQNSVVRFYALNCIFADGFGKAYSVYPAGGGQTVSCPLWPSPRYDPTNKGELMVNIAGARGDLFDSDSFTRSIRGVLQYGFKPKHAATARYGQAAYTFTDGTTMTQPALDIVRLPQTGLYHSMGSFYIDDREAPSIAVSTAEDVTDPYDDVISLREAVAYGGADDRFASQSEITPTFDSALEEEGVVTLAVTGVIQVATTADGERTSYQNLALRIAPGEGQRLVIRSATNSYDGVFSQKAGTKLLQFDRVRFDRCGSIRGDGGVLDTEGRYRFDDCAFDACWSTGVGGLPGSEFVANINRAIQAVHDAGFTDDFGLASVCQITNGMNDVAEKLQQVADIMRQSEPDMARVKALADEVWDVLSQAVDSTCTTLSGILVKLKNAEFDVWDDSGKLAKLREAQNLVTACKGNLQTFLTDGGFGLGGAIRARAGSDGIILDASASRCYAMSAGGVVACEGRLVGANLTFCRNTAGSGAAVACRSGTNLFASAAFVDNVSATNGAVHASGGFCGIVNSIVVGNKTASGTVCNMTAADGAATNVQYTLCGADVAKSDVFDKGGEPIIALSSNGVEQLYYPLDPTGRASGTGAYVFFRSERGGQDCRQAGWLNEVLYSTDPDGFFPRPQPLAGTKTGCNTYLKHDQLGNPVEWWDLRTQLALPASMGPVPKMASVGPSAVVTTTKDDTDAAAGVTTLRAAAEYAMANGVAVTFADGLFAGGATPVFELSRQIDVPKGAALRIIAGSGRTVELRPAEATTTNKFFTVFAGGSLAASGLTLQGGFARVDSSYMQMQPTNPGDGGAVQGFGPIAFSNCIFRANTAPGHGGAIWSCGGLSLSGCLFETNCAGAYGGAVYSDRERLDMSGTKFVDNVAQKGGAIYVNNSTNVVCLETTDIVRNVARGIGGGLYLGDDEILLEQGLVVIKGTDVRIVGNTVGDEGKSDNVFVGEKVKFDPQTLNRPPAEYTKVAVVDGVVSLVLDEEKATPIVGDFDLGLTEFDSVAVSVGNVVPGLLYGLGRAETPVGPYVVENWVRAKAGESVTLTASKEGASGFYRIIARE